jgi:hypothetical protein
VLFEQPAPANEVPEVKLSGSAKRQRALAKLPTTNYQLNTFFAFSLQLSAFSFPPDLPLAAQNRRFLPLLTD